MDYLALQQACPPSAVVGVETIKDLALGKRKGSLRSWQRLVAALNRLPPKGGKKRRTYVLADLLGPTVAALPQSSDVDSAPRLASRGAQANEGPPAAKDFRAVLRASLTKAAAEGSPHLDVKAGDLHRVVGGYPGPRQRMPVCCSVMRQELKKGDSVLEEPPKGVGASLVIRFLLPR